MPSESSWSLDQLNRFRNAFSGLTGSCPFPWQEHLYLNFFSQGAFPSSCNVPTGLGKTSVIAVWLIALAHHTEKLPRRLVYVVNRRTVVDQTTSEVERLRGNLRTAGLFEPLNDLCALKLNKEELPLAISTLRGQFADNREWSRDPARPAVIVGTVDMIGSRLLFSGYGVGFKGRPLHAGFLGQDVLLVHDEAHLEPAFQRLLAEISAEQRRSKEFGKFHLMALTATSRNDDTGTGIELTEQEQRPPDELPEPPSEPVHVVWRRLKAEKDIAFHSVDHDNVAREIGQLALRHKDSRKAVLVFVRTVEDVHKVERTLKDRRAGVSENQVQILTGTLRGLERDRLVKDDPVFARFLRPSDGPSVYLVCTSAGEVGVDISADHMVCDLTPLDSMMQRLGRVNRRGEGAAEVDVVYEEEPDPKRKDEPFERARWETLKLLRMLPLCNRSGDRLDASPLALRGLTHGLSEEERRGAFTPEPAILPVSDILFDSWALTTVRGRLPGRAPVEPYLHGLAEWEPPKTCVAWRDEVEHMAGDLLEQYKPGDLLEDYPLKPHELLRDRSDRVLKELQEIAKRKPDAPAWLVDDDGGVELATMRNLTEIHQISYRTVLLAPRAGGLDKGFLSGDSDFSEANNYDVADEWNDGSGKRTRVRVWDDAPTPDGMRMIRRIDIQPYAEETEEEERPGASRRYWCWYELPRVGDGDGSKAAAKPVALDVHTSDVTENAKRIVGRLALPEDILNAIVVAAKYHDLGKRRPLFQRILGNMKSDVLLAKSGRNGQAPRLPETYRHEFGSLLDAETEREFSEFPAEMKDLILHLIAAHHGRARPHFRTDEAFDPEPNGRDVTAIADEIPRRFARLQRRYGRWGLAYLESLLRAADYAASANPSAFLEDAQ